jgi:hypothetical protein
MAGYTATEVTIAARDGCVLSGTYVAPDLAGRIRPLLCSAVPARLTETRTWMARSSVSRGLPPSRWGRPGSSLCGMTNAVLVVPRVSTSRPATSAGP